MAADWGQLPPISQALALPLLLQSLGDQGKKKPPNSVAKKSTAKARRKARHFAS